MRALAILGFGLVVGAPAPGEAQQSSETTASPTLNGTWSASLEGAMQAYPATPGVGQGGAAGDIAETVLRDLGRFVADRATSNAFRLLRSRVIEWLECGEGAATSPPEGGLPAGPVLVRFDATCGVIEGLEIGTLATAPDLLRDALLVDLADIAFGWLDAGLGEDEPAKWALELLSFTIRDTVVRAFRGGNGASLSDIDARAIVFSLLQQARDMQERRGTQAESLVPEHQRAFFLAAGGLAKCIAERPATSALAECNVLAEIDALIALAPDENAKNQLRSAMNHARVIALGLQTALTLETRTSGIGSPDTRGRIRHAVDAAFASACVSLGGDAACESQRGDESDPDRLGRLKTARSITLALADRDPSAAAVAIADVLREMLGRDSEEAREHSRAVRLVSALATYGEQVARDVDGDADTDEAQSARQDLIESIADEFTDRTARDGDWVASFGGTLRLVGGARTGHTGGEREFALLSPVGLTLGFSLYRLNAKPRSAVPGFWMEAAIVDLGQYVSFESGVQVRTPEVVDAFSPMLTAGMAWGRSMPVVVGGFVGYSPSYQFSDNDKKGAIHFGLAVALNVPIFDLN